MRTYLDHNATTPVRPEASALVQKALAHCGNPSSVHHEGRAAKSMLETARANVAHLVGARASDVTFTSSGTEANNLVIKGARVETIFVSAIEHSCVVEAARNSGRNVVEVPVSGDGVIDLLALDQLLGARNGKALVSVMAANNETGVVQPLREIADIVHAHDAIMHTDAVQAAGKCVLNMVLSGVDCMTLSAHKLGGLAGSGALIALPSVVIDPVSHGGGQELRRRPGTENLVGIAAFGAAANAVSDHPLDVLHLRDQLEKGMRAVRSDVVIFGENQERLCNTTYFAVAGMSAEMLLIAFDLADIAVSSGSACSSGKVTSSYVLNAMGIDRTLGAGAIRVSLGWTSTHEDVERFLAAFKNICGSFKGSKQGKAA